MRTTEFPGYMEADLVLVGSEQGGRIAELSVEEGNSVKQGDPIFVLESSEQEASVAAARSRVQEAEARLADVKAELQRPDEIKVLEAALNEAQGHAAGGDQQSRACAVAVRQRLDHQGAARRRHLPA